MIHEQLNAVIERYIPTMLDVSAPAPPELIERLNDRAGPLPESYREFLGWMGERCPFFDNLELAYAPTDLLKVYEDPEEEVPKGFLLVGIDNSGGGLDVHIRRADGAVLRLSAFYDGVTNRDAVVENASFPSFMLAAFVQKTLVPSHPFHFAAALKGDGEQIQELWHRVDEACANFAIPYSIRMPDCRFYGGNDFVIGLHHRPASSIVNVHFGAVDRARYEPWYDLVFARWQLLRIPA
jgi:hypothetical protein